MMKKQSGTGMRREELAQKGNVGGVDGKRG